jgi:hypothetical protein
MSTTQPTDTDDLPPPPAHFAERADNDDERWIEDWITAYLDLTLGPKQREICRSVVNNETTAVVGANGTGKTYVTAAIVLAWQNVRYPAISFGTSGTGKKLYRTLCRPIDKLQGAALGGVGLPGTFKQQPPRIDYDDPEHYFEAATPTDAGELEGAHEGYTLAIIEEADKDDVTAQTVDAMRSLVTDYEKGRMLVVGNPPRDEGNVFARLIHDSPAWHTIRVSSFDSHNVLVESGESDGEIIDGMATVSALRKDWQDYHDIPWPGIEQARAWSDLESADFREDLSQRWYRRRAGVMPPGEASVHRPLEPEVVEAAYQPDATPDRKTPESLGVDVARSGDDTVAAGPHEDHIVIEYERTGTDHTEQEQELADKIREWPTLDIAVDAVGEGSGLADGLNDRFGTVHRFKNSEVAADKLTYDRCWGESLALFAAFLEAGGTFSHRKLYEQAKIAAREVTWNERELDRGDDGAKVLSATPKDDVKQRLGRSPDHLDAALMAAWAREANPETDDRITNPVFGL